jgi:hypothetical protein
MVNLFRLVEVAKVVIKVWWGGGGPGLSRAGRHRKDGQVSDRLSWAPLSFSPDQMVNVLRLVEVAEVVIGVELLGLLGLGLLAPLAMREAVRSLQVQQLTQLIHQPAEHPNLGSSE